MIRQKDGFVGERQIVLPPMVVEMERSDSLASSLYITDIGYYPSATHHYRERKTPISQFVLIYCVEGTGWYSVSGKEYKVQSGEYFVLPPNQPHSYGASERDSWTIYWIHFSGEHACIYAEGMLTPQRINVAMNSRIMDRINIFEEILRTLHSGNGIEELRYASSLLHYFLASMRYIGLFRGIRQQENPEAASLSANQGKFVCEAAIHFMKENLENSIKLQHIAGYTGYSQTHFSSMFKKHMGMSPMAYFNHLKIKQACYLLRETDLKVNQICRKLCIDDQYYFSRLFSKIMNISPTAYRKQKMLT